MKAMCFIWWIFSLPVIGKVLCFLSLEVGFYHSSADYILRMERRKWVSRKGWGKMKKKWK